MSQIGNIHIPPLFEPEKSPKHLHVGLRIIKTALAVFISAAIGYLRGERAFFSMIAAIICIQPTEEQTIVSSFNRTVGSLIGGFCGMCVVFFAEATGLIHLELLYLLFVSLCIIPVILITLAIKKPTTSSFSCIVFTAVTVLYAAGGSPLHSALNRVLDTEIGVVVALLINLINPHNAQK